VRHVSEAPSVLCDKMLPVTHASSCPSTIMFHVNVNVIDHDKVDMYTSRLLSPVTTVAADERLRLLAKTFKSGSRCLNLGSTFSGSKDASSTDLCIRPLASRVRSKDWSD
jgi:hypothetical protein